MPVISSIFPKSTFWLMLAVLFFAGHGLQAKNIPGGDSGKSYVSPLILAPQLLPPPPAEGSEQWQQEIEEVLEAQKNVSAANLAEIRDEQHLTLNLITEVIDADFTSQRFPRSFALLNRVVKDAGAIIDADKKFWHTRRPYLTDQRVTLQVDPIDNSPSYPSGHTAEARVLGEVLGLLYPQQLDALRTRASIIAEHRIEAGVHYPVDIESGKMLAMLILGALMENPDFRNDLAAARMEIIRSQ